MLSQEERMRIFWASSPQNVRAIPTFQFSHALLSSTKYYWTEPYIGAVTLDTAEVVDMNPANIVVKLADSENTLEQNYTFTVDLTDSQDILRTELDNIPVNTLEKLILTYREYLSDTLTVVQAQVTLLVVGIDYNQNGAQFRCVTPRGNLTLTGENYTPFEIPMLRGFL
jgi:hypothetical protein